MVDDRDHLRGLALGLLLIAGLGAAGYFIYSFIQFAMITDVYNEALIATADLKARDDEILAKINQLTGATSWEAANALVLRCAQFAKALDDYRAAIQEHEARLEAVSVRQHVLRENEVISKKNREIDEGNRRVRRENEIAFNTSKEQKRAVLKNLADDIRNFFRVHPGMLNYFPKV